MQLVGRIIAAIAKSRYSVVAIRAGRDLNGKFYTPRSLRQLASIARAKVPVNLFPELDANGNEIQNDHLRAAHLVGRSPLNQCGFIENLRWSEEEQGLVGELTILETDRGEAVERQLAALAEAGGLDSVGLSIDSEAVVGPTGEIIEFTKLNSFDIVTHPAAGGRIGHRIAASRRATGGKSMSWFQKLSGRFPDLCEGLTSADKVRTIASKIAERLTPERVTAMEGEEASALSFLLSDLAQIESMDKAELIGKLENVIKFLKTQDGEAPAEGDGDGEGAGEPVAASRNGGGRLHDLDAERAKMAAQKKELDDSIRESRLERSRGWLERACAGRKLPAKITERVLAAHKDRLLKDADEADAIAKAEQEYADSLIEGAALPRVQVTRSSVQNATDILTHLLAPHTEVPKCGIGNIGYSLNRFDRQFFPGFDPDDIGPGAEQRQRVRAAIDSTAYNQVYADALRRAFIALYERDPQLMDWKKIVRIQSVPDFRTQHVIRDGWYGFLPDVGERDPYPTLTTPTDTEETGALKKTGGIETYSIEARANDDLGLLQRILGKLAWTAAETLYNHCFSQIRVSTMPTLSDGKKLFDATRTDVNGGTLPITPDDTGRNNFITARNMMRSITGGSGQKKGIRPRYIILPIEKEGAYEFIRQALQGGNTGLDVPGYLERRGSAMPEPITDIMAENATDWVLLADPLVAEVLRCLFWQGRQDPELLISDNDLFGALFVRDVIELKIRHIYKCFAVDYAGIVGEDSGT